MRFERTIQYLFGFKVLTALVGCFTYFSTPHIIRQVDTMGVSLRYWMRWFIETELSHPFLPAVLTSGDQYGISPMEFPLLNILFAPFFALPIEEARIASRIFLILVHLLLVWWSYRIWRLNDLFVERMKSVHLLLVVYSVSGIYFDKFMPDFISFLLVLIAIGLSWQKRTMFSFVLASIGMLMKPPAVIVFGLFLFKKPKIWPRHALWVVPALLITGIFYTKGMDYLRLLSDVPEYFRVGMKNPFINFAEFFSEPKKILNLFLKSFFTAFTFILILIDAIWKKRKDQGILFLVLSAQLLVSIFLSGEHNFIHDYYFIGASFLAALIYVGFLQQAHKVLVILSLVLLSFHTVERSYYSLRQFARDHDWAQCSRMKDQIPQEIIKVNSTYSKIPFYGLCFGKIQNAKSSPITIDRDQAGKIIVIKTTE